MIGSFYKWAWIICESFHTSNGNTIMPVLVNFSRIPRDLVPSEARDQIEWRVKSLTTYLVHVLHEKSNSLLFLFNLLWPFSISLSFNQDYLNYCNSVSANSIISALKGILPVFHGQGREHSEQFLGILIITRSPPPVTLNSFICVSRVSTMSFTHCILKIFLRPVREDLRALIYKKIIWKTWMLMTWATNRMITHANFGM